MMKGGLRADASTSEVGKHLRALVHELNNPLAVMMGFTQLIMLDGRCEPGMRADLEKVYSEMKRAAAVVERLHACALSLERGSADGTAKLAGFPEATVIPTNESR